MKKKTVILILGLTFILISGFIITSRAIYNSRFKTNYNAPADRKEASCIPETPNKPSVKNIS